MAEVTTSPDLTKTPPRSPRTRIHGYAIIARTLDKCRAFLGGKIGDYHFDCPLDNMLFGFKGVKGDDFKAQVQAHGTDDQIASWLDNSGTPKSPEEIEAWSSKVESYLPYNDPEKKNWFVGECEGLGLDPKTTTLFDYLEADDANFKPSA